MPGPRADHASLGKVRMACFPSNPAQSQDCSGLLVSGDKLPELVVTMARGMKVSGRAAKSREARVKLLSFV